MPAPDPGQSKPKAGFGGACVRPSRGKRVRGCSWQFQPALLPLLLFYVRPLFSPESPFELLFWRPRRGDVDGEQELFEIYEPIFVRVEGAEDVVAELFCVATREAQLVHVNELGRGQPAIGAVLLETLVPLLDSLLVVTRVRLKELKVFLTQSLLALYATHAACHRSLPSPQTIYSLQVLNSHASVAMTD